MKSLGNILYVLFYADQTENDLGFRANFTHIQRENDGRYDIQSPTFPQNMCQHMLLKKSSRSVRVDKIIRSDDQSFGKRGLPIIPRNRFFKSIIKPKNLFLKCCISIFINSSFNKTKISIVFLGFYPSQWLVWSMWDLVCSY